MKGSAHRVPHYPSIAKAHARAVEITQQGKFRANVVFEYLPLAKIMSVPAGTTAFRRDATPTILIVIVWKELTEENADHARGYAHELVKIATGGGQSEVTAAQSLGYGNYGMFFQSHSGF